MPDTCIRADGAVWTSCTCDKCRPMRLRNAKLYRNGRLPILDERAKAANRFELWKGRGYSTRAISDMTGISERTVQSMFQGRSDPTRMMHRTARRILDAPDVPTGRGWVPSIGCVRRLRALTVMGWSMRTLSQRCGLDESTLAALRSDQHTTTRPRFHAIVAGLYDELWDVPGPGVHAATRARNRGWLPPLAWDDDTLDDPNAEPDAARKPPTRNRPVEDTAEDVADLLTWEPLATVDAVAERLGYADRTGVQNALTRAGRQDLLDQFTRNARLAGFGINDKKASA